MQAPAPRSSFLHGRRLWILVVVAVLIIVGAVLGGVLGTTLNHKSNNSSAQPVTTTTSNPTAAPTSTSRPIGIRENSPLAVTGWRTGGNFSIRVYFQNDDNYLSYSAYESGTGNWTQTSNFTTAKAGSPLAVTNFNHSFYATDTVQFLPFMSRFLLLIALMTDLSNRTILPRQPK